MVHLLQFGIVVWLLAVSRRVVRNSPAANLLGIARWIVSLAAGISSGWLVCRWIWRSLDNFVLELLVAYAAGAVVFILVSALLAGVSRRFGWAQRSTSALALPKWFGRASNGLLLLSLWLAALMAIDLTTRLRFAAADVSVTAANAVRPPLVAAAPDVAGETERVRSAMALQGAFLGRLRQGLEQSKEEFYRKIGAGEFLDRIEAVQQIMALPNEEKAWLLKQNPEIAGLIDHPMMQRIVRNDALMARFDRVRHGSLSAILEVGEDADVRQLLEDPYVLQVVRQADPVALLQQLQRHRRDIAGNSDAGNGGSDAGGSDADADRDNLPFR